jgi:hypothetical protein
MNKEQLDRLAAQIFLKTGKKFAQQELLAFCVQFANEHLDDFVSRITNENRVWTPEEIDQLEQEYITDFGKGTESLSEKINDIVYEE